MTWKYHPDVVEDETLGLDAGLEALNETSQFEAPVERRDGHESNDHLALVYESPTERLDTVVPFLRRGLERGERCMYVGDEDEIADLIEALYGAGVDVAAARESGALAFATGRETYLRDGSFDAEEMLETQAEAIADASEEYEAFRLAAETDWVMDADVPVEEFVAYESRVNELFDGEDCLALCLYDREAFTPDVLRDVVRVHPYLVCDEAVCQNVYYVPPEEFSGPGDASREVDRMLGMLRDRTETNSALTTRERYLCELNEITADPDRSFEEKLDALFELGRERFDLELGGMARVDVERDEFEVEYAAGADVGFRPGFELPLSETFCAITAERKSTASVREPRDAGRDDREDLLVSRELGIQTYLGTYVGIEEGVDRTLFFASRERREEPFSEGDRTFLGLMGQWAKSELERETVLDEHRRLLEEHELVFDRMSDVFTALDTDWRITHLNEGARRAIVENLDEDLSKEELVGRNLWQINPDVDEDALDESPLYRSCHEAMERQEVVSHERYYEGKDLWVSTQVYPSETGVSIFSRDVTERKKRERQLERHKEYNDDVLDAIDDLFYVVDEAEAHQRWSEAARKVTGYTREEAESMDPTEFLAGEDREAAAAAITECFETGHTRLEADLMTKDGERIPYEFVASTLENPDGETVVAGIGRDVSERVERERRLETLVSNLPGMVYRCANRPDWPFEYVDGEVEQLTGYTAAELQSDELCWGEDVLHPEDRERAWGTVQEAIEARDSYELTYRIVTEDGTTRWMWERGRGIYTADGELEALEGFVTDVTERNEHERELELFRSLIDRSNDSVFVVDPDTGRFQDVNETACRRLGYDREELLGRSVAEISGEVSDFDDFQSYFEHVREEGSILVEVVHERADGTTFPVEVTVDYVELDDEYLVGVARDVSERVERERYQRELYEITARRDLAFEEKLRELLELGRERFGLEMGVLAYVSGDTYEIVEAFDSECELEPGLTLPFSETYCRKTVQLGEPLGVTNAPEEGWADDPAYDIHGVSSYVGTTVTAGTKTYGTLCFASRTPREERFTDAEYTFLELMSQWVSYELERDHRETQLAALTELSQDLMSAETHEEIAARVIEHAEGALELPLTAMAPYDEGAGELRVSAETERASDELPGESLCERGSGWAWKAFVADEARVGTDPPDDLTELMAMPLGPLGVFVTATTAEGGFEDAERDLVTTTAATVEAAYARTERERQLRERERTLEEQKERLERLDRTNTTIRNIDRALVGASTREEIEAVVCEQMADAGPYELAWIGEHDRVSEEVVPTQWAGDDRGYLDEITTTVDDSTTDMGPTGQAVATREPQIVDDVLVDRSNEPWRREALDRGYHSTAALPLVYEESLYGVLNVYAGQPGAFDDMEQAVLTELADNVAYALNAVESKKALVTDQVTELEFAIGAADSDLVAYLEDADASLSMEKLVAGADGRLRGFQTTRGLSPEEVTGLESGFPFGDVQILSVREEGDEPVCLFEAELYGDRLFPLMLEHGGRPRTMVVEDGSATVVVELAVEADVRGFVELLRDQYPNLELIAQRTREHSRRTPAELYASLTEDLTARQREVLETAYFSGYFERPRLRTGSEIAERLDVSQPTFNAHVRSAQRKLCRLLFEEESGG